MTLGLDTLGTHIVYDSGDYALLLDKALSARRLGRRLQDAAWRTPRQAAKKSAPALPCSSRRADSGPFDTVRIDSDARRHGRSYHRRRLVGQGVETVAGADLRRCARRRLRHVTVVHGQTDRIDHGMGAFASRVTVMCGEATRLAAIKLRARGAASAAAN